MSNPSTVSGIGVSGAARNQWPTQVVNSTSETILNVNTDSGISSAYFLKVPVGGSVLGAQSPFSANLNAAITARSGRTYGLPSGSSNDQFSTESWNGRRFLAHISGVGFAAANAAQSVLMKMYQGTSSSLGSDTLIGATSNVTGSSGAYSILAYSGITNTGGSVITGGKIGSFPTSSITGFPPGTLTAPAVIDNANSAAAQTALAAQIVYFQGLTPTTSGLTNLSTGGSAGTYTAGNYFGSTSLTMPTGITLDAAGNPNAVFVFVAGSTINLASGQTVALINGAQAANVYFVAGTSFTSVATSTVNGNILAGASITLGGGTLNGRALANTGAVTISGATAITTTPSALLGAPGFPMVAGGPFNWYVEETLIWDTTSQILSGAYEANIAFGTGAQYTNKIAIPNVITGVTPAALSFLASTQFGFAAATNTITVKDFLIDQI
jgi:hypothetical protein